VSLCGNLGNTPEKSWGAWVNFPIITLVTGLGSAEKILESSAVDEEDKPTQSVVSQQLAAAEKHLSMG